MTGIKRIAQPMPLPLELAIDWGLVDPALTPDPEPTPIERALGILLPHLRGVALYQPPAV